MKKTPWFPGDVKPVLVGVYERKRTRGTFRYSYWNGRYWLCSAQTIMDAAYEAKSAYPLVSFKQESPWRGLANPPKKASRK